MGRARATKFFKQDANNLIMIGRLVAADICLNNSDRFPVKMIWATSGNTHNMLFKVTTVTSENLRQDIDDVSLEFDTLFAIDNSSNPIKQSYDAYIPYLKSIDKFVSYLLGEVEANK